MDGWKSINLHGAARIRKVVGVFEISENTRVPYGKFKIKVLEDSLGGYLAFPNLAYLKDGEPDWTSGLGETIETALQDALFNFMESLPKPNQCSLDYFEWSAPEDF